MRTMWLDMNLEQVAKRAKVSTATVSRVLNNASVVKGSPRARVVKAIEELKYYPNLHARSLAGGKSRTLGVIVSNLENPFFFDIYKTLEADAHAQGFEVMAANTDYSPEQLVSSVHLMIGRRVAGLAAIVSEMAPELMEELAQSRIPVVFYDVGTTRGNVTSIRVNYRRGIEKVVDYLQSLGHRRLAFVGHHAVLGPGAHSFAGGPVRRRRRHAGRRTPSHASHPGRRFPAHGDYLRQRYHCRGRVARTAGARTASARRRVGHRIR